jgi:NAD+ synthase
MFSRDVLALECGAETQRITDAIRAQVLGTLRRRGAVVGLSGGIDSSVVGALCALALGRENVVGLLMPERDSSGDALRLGRALAAAVGIETLVEDIQPTLAAAGCYARQDEAVRMVFDDYLPGDRFKITLPSILEGDRLAVSQLTLQRDGGEARKKRMPLKPYLQLVAATNFKQRTRKMMEYYHADRLNYAVAGTPNRLEYELGFFVKGGDGAADLKPIAHLYKTQVFALAEHLGVPEEIRRRPPTTDTFSLPQGQDEFYFSLPYAEMDLCLWAFERGLPAAEVAPVVGLGESQVERVYKDIVAKRRVSEYLKSAPLLVEGEADGGPRA